MDEPLSNLDAKLRVSMRAQLGALHARLATTTIYVTHDQIEAMTLGQRVAVMRDGKIQQVDTPQTLYGQPANLFVAAFIGSPAMNLVEADVRGDMLHFGGYALPLPADAVPPEGRVIAGMRPEAFEDAAFSDASLPQLDVLVEVVEELGADTHVIFAVDAPQVEVEELRDAAGDDDLATVAGSLFTARVNPGTAARPGAALRLAVDPSRFHYFDPETGRRLAQNRDAVRDPLAAVPAEQPA